MAGLACARRLADTGLAPVVFDKGRGLGGRLATRRSDHGAFDHGAQYVTARTPAFRAFLDDLKAEGAAADWRPVEQGASPPKDWTVGAPAMNALVKPLARDLDLRLKTPVAAARRDGYGWRLETPAEPAETFDLVVSTVPAPQARDLFAAEPGMAERLDGVEIAPCLALMAAFDAPTGVPFDVRRFESGPLAWLARNGSKPGRGAGECWTLHASPSWSREHLELALPEVAERLRPLFLEALGGGLPEITHAAAHRWRYALVTAPLGQSHLASDDGSLLIGGDWCLGPRVEYAFQSGQALADAVLARVG